ncbi:MAG: hypothetical protein AAF938_01450 [Myxococcota bacterium]
MKWTPKQSHFEGIAHVDADPETRRLLLMHKSWEFSLVHWTSGERLVLPRFSVPDRFHQQTQGRKAYTMGASVLDIRLAGEHAHVLTTEGHWTCELREGADWVRVSGHPHDPPKGVTASNAKSRGFNGPIALARDGKTLRHGSARLQLSADGSTLVGAPSLYDMLGCAMDYELRLKSLTQENTEPTTLPVKLRSDVAALAVSADGAYVAFSEGRDFRILRRGKKRASHFKHNKMRVKGLALSADGRFAAACGIYPSDLRFGPKRTVLWDVVSREVLDIIRESALIAFVGAGDRTRLVLGRQRPVHHSKTTFQEVHESGVFVPGERKSVATIERHGATQVRGDSRFLAVRCGSYDLHVFVDVEAVGVRATEASKAAAESQHPPTSLIGRIDERPGSTANIFLYYLGNLTRTVEAGRAGGLGAANDIWGASTCLVRYALLEGDMAATSVLLETIVPSLTSCIEAHRPDWPLDWKRVIGFLTFHRLSTGGLTAPALDVTDVRKALRRLEPRSQQDALRFAWFALAEGDLEHAAKLVPFDPMTQHKSRTFKTNEKPLFAHLYRAAAGLDDADAQGAWDAWLRVFPAKLDQEWSTFPELLASAHVKHCLIEGNAPDTLLGWLCSEVRRAL